MSEKRICPGCGCDWTDLYISRVDGVRKEITNCYHCDTELPTVHIEQRIDGELLSLIRLLTKILDAGWKLVDSTETRQVGRVWEFAKDRLTVICDGKTDIEALEKAWHYVSLLDQSEPPVRSSKSPQEIANEFGESHSRIIQEPNPKDPKSFKEMDDKFGEPSIESSEEWLSAVKYGAMPIPARYAAVILDELSCMRADVAKLRGEKIQTEDSLKIACLRQEVVRLHAESEKLRGTTRIDFVEDAVRDATGKIATSRDAWQAEAMASRKELDERFKRIAHLENVCKELREHVSRIAADCSAMDRRCYELANLVGDKDRRIAELDQIAKETFGRKAQLEEDNKELNKRIYELEAVSSQLTRDMDLIKVSDADGVWYWQHDGNDHPENITCPVVMSADTMRTILAERDANAKRVAELEEMLLKTNEKIIIDLERRHDEICRAIGMPENPADKRISELEEMLHNERDTMGAEQIRLSGELKKAEARIAELGGMQSIESNRASIAEGRAYSLTNELTATRILVEQKNIRISELEDGNNRISKCWVEETEALKLEIGSLRREIDSLHGRIADYCEGANKTANVIRAERDKLKAEVERLRGLLAQTLSE